MMSMLCNCCVRELLILARTWFAFGLPSKTGCDTLREARSQKRKATSPTLQEEELDQEIRDLVIHQQVQRKKGEDGPAGRPSEEDRRSR